MNIVSLLLPLSWTLDAHIVFVLSWFPRFPVQDNTKEEKMIDKMVQDGIGAMLVQETWNEGNHNNVEIGDTGCYMFSHNREIGKGGKDHISRRCNYTIPKLCWAYYGRLRERSLLFPNIQQEAGWGESSGWRESREKLVKSSHNWFCLKVG